MKWIIFFLIGSTSFAGVPDCNELGFKFRQKLSVPYKTFSDASTKSCIYKTNVNSENLPLFIASTFYFKNLGVRKKALAKMEDYSCENFYNFLDSHIKATILAQPKFWKEFSDRANLLRVKTQAKVDELKNAQ